MARRPRREPEKPSRFTLWPETPAVENERQPFVLMRSLRSVQDQVAQGSTTAHQFQKNFMRDLGIQLMALPPAVWDDPQRSRGRLFRVERRRSPRAARRSPTASTPDFIDRRILRGAFAYGEGRSTDAKALLEKMDARSLDPALGGMLSLIQGVLYAKSDPKKAIAYFDDARLLSPGTLVEESALRQEILLLAKEGDTARFDVLSDQYSRRFSKSLFASTFRRQFVAGFARQSYKGMSDWISRTETELQKMPEEERLGMYLAIAEEATKGGHFEIAKFASDNALKLASPGRGNGRGPVSMTGRFWSRRMTTIKGLPGSQRSRRASSVHQIGRSTMRRFWFRGAFASGRPRPSRIQIRCPSP